MRCVIEIETGKTLRRMRGYHYDNVFDTVFARTGDVPAKNKSSQKQYNYENNEAEKECNLRGRQFSADLVRYVTRSKFHVG